MKSLTAIFIAAAASFFLACSSFSQAPVPLKKELIDFNRPLSPGMAFRCDAETKTEMSYLIRVLGEEPQPPKKDSVSAKLAATLLVLSVNNAGNPASIELKIESLSGSINGKSFDFTSLSGASVVADLSSKPCKFSLKPAMEPLDQNAAKILSSVFRPASECGLKDIMDPGRPVAIGESWTPPLALFASILKKTRGLSIPESKIKATATLESKGEDDGIMCWRIRERIESKPIDGLDFRFEIAISLPVDPALGGAIRISRTGIEVVNRPLPADNPVSIAKEIEAVSQDSMSASLVPVKTKAAAAR